MTNRDKIEEFVEDFAIMMEGFMADNSDYRVSLERLDITVGDLKEDITSLLKVVRDGNGQPPMTTRLAVLEEKVSEVDRKMGRWWSLLLAAVPGARLRSPDRPSRRSRAMASMHDFQMESITGETVSLSRYEGKVSLVVNLASQ